MVAADSVASASAARPALLMLTVDDADGVVALTTVVLLASLVEVPAGAGAAETDAVETDAADCGDAGWMSGLTFIRLFSLAGKLRKYIGSIGCSRFALSDIFFAKWILLKQSLRKYLSRCVIGINLEYLGRQSGYSMRKISWSTIDLSKP